MMISVLLRRGFTARQPTHQSAGGAFARRLARWKIGGVGRAVLNCHAARRCSCKGCVGIKPWRGQNAGGETALNTTSSS